MLKVLIAEDDLMIADLTEQVLVGSGYAVCGIARTIAEAVDLAKTHAPDLAIVDMRLADGDLGTDLARQLGFLRGLGLLYATGNVPQVMALSPSGCACLAKPYRTGDLLRSLEIVSEILATGVAAPPFPRGFSLLPAARRQLPGHG